MFISDEKIFSAKSKIKELETTHNNFICYIDSSNSNNEDYSAFGKIFTKGKLSAECLGLTIEIHHRIVAIDSEPKLLEYSYILEESSDKKVISRIYLNKFGQIFNDSREENALGEYTNEDIVKLLLKSISGNLLVSEVFIPKDTN